MRDTLQVQFLTNQKSAYQFRRVVTKLELKYWEYESQVVSQRVAERCAILLIRCFQKEFELNKQEIKLGKFSSLNKSLDWE